ncbi:MAG: RusA family crossover junction endodeoxyribonuclease [Gammaproteobacteria bacterium]|nr:RusA family crossover junction endodeoxyribonuclease [Gammaproteobacteria bacterium]
MTSMTFRDVLTHRRRSLPPAPLRLAKSEPELICEWTGFTPIGAPRSNARTHFGSGKDAERIKRYHAYRDALGERAVSAIGAGRLTFEDLTGHLGLVFRFPVPPSWSLKQQVAAVQFGEYHQQKPDIDNLVKAFLDALLEQDSACADVRAVKVWVPRGQEGVQVWRLPIWV